MATFEIQYLTYAYYAGFIFFLLALQRIGKIALTGLKAWIKERKNQGDVS